MSRLVSLSKSQGSKVITSWGCGPAFAPYVLVVIVRRQAPNVLVPVALLLPEHSVKASALSPEKAKAVDTLARARLNTAPLVKVNVRSFTSLAVAWFVGVLR